MKVVRVYKFGTFPHQKLQTSPIQGYPLLKLFSQVMFFSSLTTLEEPNGDDAKGLSLVGGCCCCGSESSSGVISNFLMMNLEYYSSFLPLGPACSNQWDDLVNS